MEQITEVKKDSPYLFKMRSSALGLIMSEPKGGHPKKRLAGVKATILDLEEKQGKVKNKDGVQYINRAAKIKEYKQLLPELEELANKPFLGETVKSYISDWLKGSVWGRRKQIRSKYLDKGNMSEEDAIDLTSMNFGELYIKNERHYSNDFFTGTPDVVHGNPAELIIDVKCSWSLDTFPMYETKIKNKLYWWQLQCYMELTGARKAKLCYTLIDTPLELVLQAFKNATWKKVGAMKDLTDNEMHEIAQGMIYTLPEFEAIRETHFPKSTLPFTEIPEAYRLKTFEVNYDAEAMERAKVRVKECQEYIIELVENQESNRQIAA